MNYLEVSNNILYGKKILVKSALDESSIDTLRNIISISPGIQSAFNLTDDADSFMKMYPDIRRVISTSKLIEAFYALKLGYYLEGVPSKLVYVIENAVKTFGKDNINYTLSSITPFLNIYATSKFECDNNTYTLKGVVENIVGSSVSLLSYASPKVKSNGCYEVYVKDINQVVLLPNDIGEEIPMVDVDKIVYNKEVGLTINDVPLRCFGDRVGITKSEFDLRECF